MRKQKHQSGFAHLLIITIILGVALAGTLGFVVYQNFIVKKDDSSKTSNTITSADKKSESNTSKTSSNKNDSDTKDDPSQVALTEIASNQSYTNTGLTIKYPKTWTYTHEAENSRSGLPDSISITSPDGTVVVNFNVHYTQIGGYCENLVISQFETDSIKGYSNAVFLSGVAKYTPNNTYYYYVHAQKTSDASSFKIGGNGCGMAYGLLLTNNNIVFGLSMNLKNVQNNKTTTLTEFNKAKETDNYKIAKRIIQSLYVK